MADAPLLDIPLEDLSAELRGELDTNDKAVATWAQYMLEKAERKLFALCPSAESRVRQGNARTIAIAKDLVIEAVARVARVDPAAVGLRSESEHGYSYTVDPLTRAGNIWFPDADLAQLGCGAKASGFTPRSATLARGTVWHGGQR